MNSPRLWRHLAISLIAAAPAGGFLFGVMTGGDPDPNPIGRIVFGFMMAAVAPWHGGFPPHPEAGAGQTYNAWPHIGVTFLLIFGALALRDRTRTRQAK